MKGDEKRVTISVFVMGNELSKPKKTKPKEVSVPSETTYIRPGKEEVKIFKSSPILEAAMPQASTSGENQISAASQ